jgi:uncharacterized protein DUF4397
VNNPVRGNDVNLSTRAVIVAATLLVGTVLVGGVTNRTAAAATVAAPQDEATLYVVQGLPGATIDVAVDGQTVARNAATTNVVGPFTVGAGTRTLTFTDGHGTVVAENTIEAKAGSNSDLVLHLTTAAGDPPVVTQFANDLTAVPSDKASLTVAHTAAVPPADIRVGGKVLFANVANGESLNLVVPVGTYNVDIVPAGESSPVVFGPADLTVQGGSLNRVYAVGDPAATTMNVAVHVLKLPESGSVPPTMVDTGTGGIAVVMQLIARILHMWRG